MIVPWTRGKRQLQAAPFIGGAFHLARCFIEGRKILHARLAESTMAVVEPDLKTFVRKNLFDDEIGQSILVDVERRNRQGRFIRLKCQLTILAGSVNPDAK